MNAKEFASQLKDTIKELKEKNGIQAIQCDNLVAYLDRVINSVKLEPSLADVEKYKAELQVWVEQNKGRYASDLEMFRSVILLGQNALKSALLMNGGATVALLAFLGKLSEENADKIPIFANSLLVFVFGVLFIVIASGATYLSQWFYSRPKCWTAGFVLNLLVILLGLASYGFFVWGAMISYKAFIGF